MTLLNGILFLNNIVAKINSINHSTQDEETMYLVSQRQKLAGLQDT